MGKFGGFYKGEKKKPKKDKSVKRSGTMSSADGFTLPELIKKRKDRE